jgi:hypothetical protein
MVRIERQEGQQGSKFGFVPPPTPTKDDPEMLKLAQNFGAVDIGIGEMEGDDE